MDEHRNFLKKQIAEYNIAQPNILLTNNSNLVNSEETETENNSIFGILRTGVNTRQLAPNKANEVFNFFKTAKIPDNLKEKQEECKTIDFERYRNNYDKSSDLRCGWTYNKDSNAFIGHLGLNGKPITEFNSKYIKGFVDGDKNPNAGNSGNTVWYWNLNNAAVKKKEFDCAQIKSCSEISNAKGCGYSSPLGHGVPLRADNNYPASSRPVYTSAGQCPIVQPGGGETTYKDSCTDYNLTRDCLLQLSKKAGCKDTGALNVALKKGSIGNPGYGLSNIASFTRYTTLHPIPGNIFDESGYNTIATATENFNRLRSNAKIIAETSESYASRDLCLKKGTYDDFDFCTEYTNTTKAPFLTECLQSEFRRNGGQVSGKLYPKTQPLIDKFNTMFNTWGDYKTYLRDLSNRLDSPDIDLQTDAFNKLYGITTEANKARYVDRVQGLESFWFTFDTINKMADTFIGRRIQTELTMKVPDNMNGYMFTMFFNLQPLNKNQQPTDALVKFNIDTKGGLKVYLNRYQQSSDLATMNSSNVFADWFGSDSAVKSYSNTSCWSVKKSEPNYFTVNNYQTSAPYNFNFINMFNCEDNTPLNINNYTMSQEPDAPMISLEANPAGPSYFFEDARLRYIMPLNMIGLSQADFNTSENLGFTNKATRAYLYGVLGLKGSGYVQSAVKLGTQSWRTITMFFKIRSLPTIPNQIYYLFQYGELAIGIMKTDFTNITNIVVIYNGVTTKLNNVSKNVTYYLYISQDKSKDDNYSTYTKDLFVTCLTKSSVTCDPSNIFASLTDKKNIFSTKDIGSVWKNTSDGYKFIIGGIILFELYYFIVGQTDGVSHIAHLIGSLCGLVFFLYNRNKLNS